MRKLLWVGDAGVPTGFAKATHATLGVLRESWAVTVLGMNYRGDPHAYPYPIYAAMAAGDGFGVNRLVWMMDVVKPDLVVIQNDPWNFHYYFNKLRTAPEYKGLPIVGAVAVDGLNCRGAELNPLALAVFWTEFAEAEARKGGFTGRSAVVPLGVDLRTYSPGIQRAARTRRGFPDHMLDAFIVGNVNRNQPRKRLDLTIQYFADWIKRDKVNDAYLYLHVAPTGDSGIDCEQLARYYGISNRVILMEPEVWYGNTEEEMADTYRSFNVQLSTTQGEGFGLTTFEGMACGVPQIVPKWSALEELTSGAAYQVPCTSIAVTCKNINSVGGVMDAQKGIEALAEMYNDAALRQHLCNKGLLLVNEPQYRWRAVGEGFRDALDAIARPAITEAEWADLGRPEQEVV